MMKELLEKTLYKSRPKRHLRRNEIIRYLRKAEAAYPETKLHNVRTRMSALDRRRSKNKRAKASRKRTGLKWLFKRDVTQR